MMEMGNWEYQWLIERDAGHKAAMEYIHIYHLEPEAYQWSLEEELPGDLPILDRGNMISDNEEEESGSHVTEG